MPGRATNPVPTNGATPGLHVVEPLCAVFRRKLRAEGLKYTPERAQVLDTIVRHDGIFEADTIIDKVKGTGIRVSKATVYRTIKLLQEAGVIQRVLFDGELAHYQLVYGQSPRQLLMPIDGSMAVEVEVPGLEALCREAAASRGFRLSGYRLHVFVEKP
jgi:Fur family ferric uptake transcriptional regulator